LQGVCDTIGAMGTAKGESSRRQGHRRSVVAFNVNEHDSMADDIAAVAAVFDHVAVYRCPPADNRVVIASEVGTTDDEVRARIGALDARSGGALSFANVLRNRE
jgi:hypothetical protein